MVASIRWWHTSLPVLPGTWNVLLGGSDDIGAKGNALDNALYGNQGDNLLDDGVGADFMPGGAGNDTYVVDNAGDVVLEFADGARPFNAPPSGFGADNTPEPTGVNALGHEGFAGGQWGVATVIAFLDYRLGADVENLELFRSARHGVGNDLDNVITASQAGNRLEGGFGNDILDGGRGDDTYRYRPGDGNDRIMETGSGDHDTLELLHLNARDIRVACRLGSCSRQDHRSNHRPSDHARPGSDAIAVEHSGLRRGTGEVCRRHGVGAQRNSRPRPMRTPLEGFDGNDVVDGGAGDACSLGAWAVIRTSLRLVEARIEYWRPMQRRTWSIP